MHPLPGRGFPEWLAHPARGHNSCMVRAFRWCLVYLRIHKLSCMGAIPNSLRSIATVHGRPGAPGRPDGGRGRLPRRGSSGAASLN